MNKIIKDKVKYNNHLIGPIMRQALLHWAYELNNIDLSTYTVIFKKINKI